MSAAYRTEARATHCKKSALWRVEEVLAKLAALYAPAKSPRKYDAISELVYTILSQNTTDANSISAYDSLVAAFPTWDGVADAPPSHVIEKISRGGLAQIKGPRIQATLNEVRRRLGNFDLTFLCTMPLPDTKAWLRTLPGVGPKTASCVLLFALGMPALPVDTHVYRVSKRLGFFGVKVTAERSHDILEEMLEPDQVLPFHMYLINHGRKICKALRPLCGLCPLQIQCPASILRAGTDSACSPASQ